MKSTLTPMGSTPGSEAHADLAVSPTPAPPTSPAPDAKTQDEQNQDQANVHVETLKKFFMMLLKNLTPQPKGKAQSDEEEESQAGVGSAYTLSFNKKDLNFIEGLAKKFMDMLADQDKKEQQRQYSGKVLDLEAREAFQLGIVNHVINEIKEALGVKQNRQPLTSKDGQQQEPAALNDHQKNYAKETLQESFLSKEFHALVSEQIPGMKAGSPQKVGEQLSSQFSETPGISFSPFKAISEIPTLIKK